MVDSICALCVQAVCGLCTLSMRCLDRILKCGVLYFCVRGGKVIGWSHTDSPIQDTHKALFDNSL